MSSAIGMVAGFLLGAAGIGGVGLYLIALHPEKIQIWASWFYRGARLVIKKAEYGAIAYDVGGHITDFVTTEVVNKIDGVKASQVKVEWVNTADALSAVRPGQLIVRMRNHEERVSNILHGAMAAFPLVVAPTVRHDLAPEQSKGIDLQLCGALANQLGTPGEITYRNEILAPVLKDMPTVGPIVDNLARIDLGGLFVPVLLQELVAIGASTRLPRLEGLAAEVQKVVEFLKTIAERERGEYVDLSFIGSYIRLTILLVAAQETKVVGVAPYRRRVGIELAKGVTTVYVIATEANFAFLREVLDALSADVRVIRRPEKRVRITRAGKNVEAIIVPFDRDQSYSLEKLYADAVGEHELRVGAQVEAVVTDVQPGYALADIDGLQATIHSSDVGWGYIDDVTEHLTPGEILDVQVTGIEVAKGELHVSRKLCLPNPVDGVSVRDGRLFPFHPDGPLGYLGDHRVLYGALEYGEALIPAALPADEVEWGGELTGLDRLFGERPFAVMLIEVIPHRGLGVVSRKRAAANQWTDIRDKYRRDQTLKARVTAVAAEGVYCELEPGLTGFVPADEFRVAGFEYTEFERNIRQDQFLNVYVRNIVGGNRQRVTLGLERNRLRR